MSTQTMGDVIINMRANDVSMTQGFRGMTEEINKIQSRLFSFEGALHIGLGGAVMRTIFHELHHGIIEVGEAFSEGSKAGESFSEMMGDAILKLTGAKTHAEEFTEALKKQKEALDAYNKARGVHADTLDPKQSEFPLVKGADADLKAAQEAVDTATNGLAGPSGQLTDIDKRIADAGKNTHRMVRGPEGSMTDVEIDPKQTVEALKKQRERIVEESRVAFATLRAAEEHLAQVRKDLIDKQAEAEKAAADKRAGEYGGAVEEGIQADLRAELEAQDKVDEAKKRAAEAEERRNEQLQHKAQAIIDQSDPLAAIRHRGEDTEALFRAGFMTQQQRDTAFDKLRNESAQSRERERPTYQSLEQMARHAQEAVGKQEQLKPTLSSIDATLRDIKNNPKVAVLG